MILFPLFMCALYVAFILIYRKVIAREKRVLEFKVKLSCFKPGELSREEIDTLWHKHVLKNKK